MAVSTIPRLRRIAGATHRVCVLVSQFGKQPGHLIHSILIGRYRERTIASSAFAAESILVTDIPSNELPSSRIRHYFLIYQSPHNIYTHQHFHNRSFHLYCHLKDKSCPHLWSHSGHSVPPPSHRSSLRHSPSSSTACRSRQH